jgi:hypothetical protein
MMSNSTELILKKGVSGLIPIMMFIFFSTSSFGQETDAKESFFIEKGRMYGIITFALDQRKAENENQLLRFVEDQNRFNYRVIGGAGYAITNNLTLGLAGGYGRQKEEITFEDQDGNIVTSKKLEQGMTLAPTLRSYVPLGNGQLQILIETQLGFTFGESLERQFTDDVDKIESDFLEIDFGVSPGAVVFFDRNWAFEVTVGIAGLSTRIEKEVTNNDTDNQQRVQEAGIDLRLNLLQLNLGVAYYF